MRFAGAGIVAGAWRRACRRRTIARSPALLCLVALLSLAGCALPNTGPVAHASVTSHTPTVTATPTPWMDAPHALPTGWKAYDATHFTLALPADWQVQVDAQPDSMTRADAIYRFSTPPGDPNGWVYEWDGLTPAQVHAEFCAPTADDTVVTIAGLPMRFSVGYPPLNTRLPYDPFAYDWTFISNHGTVYWFYFYVGPNADVGHNLQLDRAVLETFAPQYARGGCA